MAITIVTGVTVNRETAWDYPMDELPYLLDEHDGETFALVGGRLWEVEDNSGLREMENITDAALEDLLYFYRAQWLNDDERELAKDAVDEAIGGSVFDGVGYGVIDLDDGWREGASWVLARIARSLAEIHDV